MAAGGSDPLFVQPINPASAPTSTGNLRLQVGSPAIDMGLDSALPATVTTDLDGNERISDGKVDLGAYEFSDLATDTTVTTNTDLSPATGTEYRSVNYPDFRIAAVEESGKVIGKIAAAVPDTNGGVKPVSGLVESAGYDYELVSFQEIDANLYVALA